jgi:hypothetical protein
LHDCTGATAPGKEQTPPADGSAASQESRARIPQYKIIDYGHADFGDATLRDDGMALEGPYFDPQDGCAFFLERLASVGILQVLCAEGAGQSIAGGLAGHAA